MASPLGNSSSNSSAEQVDSAQLQQDLLAGIHTVMGKITITPDVTATPELQKPYDVSFLLTGDSATLHLPEREVSGAQSMSETKQYKPPPKEQTQRAVQTLFCIDPELGQEYVNTYDEFQKAYRHDKMESIHKLKALIEKNPKDGEERAGLRKRLKKLTYEFAHSFHDNNIKTDSKPDKNPTARPVLQGYACLLFAILAQEDHPGAACRMAIKALIYATSMGEMRQTFPEMAMEIAVKCASELDITDAEEKVVHISRGTRAYTHLLGQNREWKWQLMKSVQPTALKVPPPNVKMALYWDHWKELCIFGKGDSDQHNNPGESKRYNEQGLFALEQSGHHNSPTYYLDCSLMNLGLPTGLDNTWLLSDTGKPLYDCQHAEHLFRACAQIKFEYPVGTEQTVSLLQEIEKHIRQGHISDVDFTRASALGVQRLFGSPVLTKKTDFADRIFEKIPSFQRLLDHGDSYPKTRRKKLLEKAAPRKTERPATEVLLAAKLLFLRGAEAEAEGKSKAISQRINEANVLFDKAEESYLASAEGGFAGGYTRLALTAASTDQADAFLEIATEKGDISAWQSMADHLLAQNKVVESQKYYEKALEIYKKYEFEEDVAQIEELLESISSKPRAPKAKKKKKKVTGITEEQKSTTDSGAASALLEPVQEEGKAEQPKAASSTKKTGVASKTKKKKAKKKTAGSSTSVPPTLEAATATPSLPVTPYINGCMESWAEQIVIMHNDAQHIIHAGMKTSASYCDPIKLTQEATIGPLSRLYQIEWINKHPASHFQFSTWLILRINMDDRRCFLFCNTKGLEVRHAEVNMRPCLEEELGKGDIKTVEILITRDPCSHNPNSKEQGGCWRLLNNFIGKHPDIQWHIRFIRSNLRHVHPREAGSTKFVRAFDETTNKPQTYIKDDLPLTIWQDQVLESQDIPNLSYAAVPTRDPKKLKEYYGEKGVIKFSPEEFSTNPHQP